MLTGLFVLGLEAEQPLEQPPGAGDAEQMPYCRCPKCGAHYHVRVAGDVAEWYREHAPDKQPGETVESLTCFNCWKQDEQAKREPEQK